MARMTDFNIPSRATTLNSRVDPGTATPQSVSTQRGRSTYRYPGFGRGPELDQAILDILSSDSFTPAVSSSFTESAPEAEEMPGDGNVGQQSPIEGEVVASDGAETVGGPGGDDGSVGGDDTNANAGSEASSGNTGIAVGPDADAQQNNAQGSTSGEGGAAQAAPSTATESAVAGLDAPAAASINNSAGDVGVDGPGGAGDGGNGNSAGAAAGGDTADANAGGDGASTWHDGGVLPGGEDGSFSEVPNQALMEGEAVLRPQVVQLIGADIFNALAGFEGQPPEMQQQIAMQFAERIRGAGGGEGAGMDYSEPGHEPMMAGGRRQTTLQAIAPGPMQGSMPIPGGMGAMAAQPRPNPTGSLLRQVLA